MSEELHTQLEEIRQAIAETEARLRELLPAEQLEAALAPLREQEATLKAKLKGSGAIAQGEGATALGERSIKAREFRAATTGDNSPLTYVEQQVVEASATAPDPAVQAR